MVPCSVQDQHVHVPLVIKCAARPLRSQRCASAVHTCHSCITSGFPMHMRTNCSVQAINSETAAMHPSTATLRRGANIFFKESARMLEEIFEFLYLGQIAVLENHNGSIDKGEYNVWMFLLTWCVAFQ